MSVSERAGGIDGEISNVDYEAAQLELNQPSEWDRQLVGVRLSLIARYGAGRDVLDLCCGTGSYLLPHLDEFKSAVAVDLSTKLLAELAARLEDPPPRNVRLVQADARDLPLPDSCVDFAWSYCSLYLVDNAPLAVAELARVVRPGGTIAVELGNRHSLNTLVSERQHRNTGSAKHFTVPFSRLRPMLAEQGFAIRSWQAFQLLPMYGTPKGLRALTPLLSPRWKSVLGRQVRGRVSTRSSVAPGRCGDSPSGT